MATTTELAEARVLIADSDRDYVTSIAVQRALRALETPQSHTRKALALAAQVVEQAASGHSVSALATRVTRLVDRKRWQRLPYRWR